MILHKPSDSEIENAFKNWLRFSKDRDGRRSARKRECVSGRKLMFLALNLILTDEMTRITRIDRATVSIETSGVHPRQHTAAWRLHKDKLSSLQVHAMVLHNQDLVASLVASLDRCPIALILPLWQLLIYRAFWKMKKNLCSAIDCNMLELIACGIGLV